MTCVCGHPHRTDDPDECTVCACPRFEERDDGPSVVEGGELIIDPERAAMVEAVAQKIAGQRSMPWTLDGNDDLARIALTALEEAGFVIHRSTHSRDDRQSLINDLAGRWRSLYDFADMAFDAELEDMAADTIGWLNLKRPACECCTQAGCDCVRGRA